VADPSDADCIRAGVARAIAEIHVCLPAKVTSYAAATRTANLEIMIDPPGEEPWPPLEDVPVQWPIAGGYGLHLPLEAGDFCWVHFSERDYSAWRTTGSSGFPAFERPHGVFPFATPGAESEPGALLALIPDAGDGAWIGKLGANGPRMIIKSGTIELGGVIAPLSDFVALAGPLMAALSALKIALSTPAVCAAPGAPCPYQVAIAAALAAWPAPSPAIAATKVKAE
jgi:hypothetical protein